MIKIFAENWSILRQYFFQILLLCVTITGVQWAFQRYFFNVSDTIPLGFVFMTILKGCVCSFIYFSQKEAKANFKYFFKGFDMVLSFTNIAVSIIVIEKLLNFALNYFNPGVDFVRLTNFYSYISKFIVVLFYGEQSVLLVFLLVLILPLFLSLKIAVAVVATERKKFIPSLMLGFRILYKRPLEAILGFLVFQGLHLYSIPLFHEIPALWFGTTTLVFALQISYFYSVFKVLEPALLEENNDSLLDEFGKK